MDSTTDEELRKQQTFTDKFMQDAVFQMAICGYTIAAAAKSLGNREQSPLQWHAGLAPSPTPCGEGASFAVLQAENRRLRRDTQRVIGLTAKRASSSETGGRPKLPFNPQQLIELGYPLAATA